MRLLILDWPLLGLNAIAHSGLASSGSFEKNQSKPYKKV
jgi:hypothetical protein